MEEKRTDVVGLLGEMTCIKKWEEGGKDIGGAGHPYPKKEERGSPKGRRGCRNRWNSPTVFVPR